MNCGDVIDFDELLFFVRQKGTGKRIPATPPRRLLNLSPTMALWLLRPDHQ
jgi:hypothetical protein